MFLEKETDLDRILSAETSGLNWSYASPLGRTFTKGLLGA